VVLSIDLPVKMRTGALRSWPRIYHRKFCLALVFWYKRSSDSEIVSTRMLSEMKRIREASSCLCRKASHSDCKLSEQLESEWDSPAFSSTQNLAAAVDGNWMTCISFSRAFRTEYKFFSGWSPTQTRRGTRSWDCLWGALLADCSSFKSRDRCSP